MNSLIQKGIAPIVLILLIAAAPGSAMAAGSVPLSGPTLMETTVDRLDISNFEAVIGDRWFKLSSNTKVYLPGKAKPGTIYNLKEGQTVRVVAGSSAAGYDRNAPVAEIHILD